MSVPRPARSFGEKISRLLTMTSGGVVCVVAALLGTLDYLDSNRELHDRIDTHAQVIAMDAAAALAFDDRASGLAALGALSALPDVGSATLFDTQHRVFARYTRRDEPPPLFADQPVGTMETGRWRVATRAVRDRGGAHGQLQIAADLRPLWRRGLFDALLVVCVSLGAAAIVYLLSRQLRGVLLDPVTELAQKARAVSTSGNYAIRAAKFSDDELGQFTDNFNEMLSQIQRQDAELKAARRHAEHASQMKDEFLATLSHELRTPMTPILGWAQALKFAARDNDQVREAATVIERNARIQTQIVDDLLDMSRIVSGKVHLEAQPVGLAPIVADAVATVQAAAQARQIEIETVHAASGLDVSGDPGRLQQVIWNLLSNAVKFTDIGGRITITLARAGALARISVTDTGQGIERDFLPLVFERFRQADSSITRRHGGLGVGLAIVKQLTELHGGSVTADSKGLGHGATFTLSLPLLLAGTSNGDATADAEPALEGRLDGVRILVVDDQTDSRELIAHLLSASGASVEQADSADAALKVLENTVIDVLVSDIAMPRRDGYDLIGEIRARNDERARVPAVAITAFARSTDREHVVAAGFDAHLPKPIDRDALVQTVSRLAGRVTPA